MEPIDLRLATVREARNADRRFTFEVITPQFTRVYQAPSAEEMSSWISAIGNALQSAMEGRSLPSRGKEKSSSTTGSGAGGIVRGVGRDIGSILTGKSTGSSNHSHSQSVSAQQKSDMFRRTTVAGRPTHSYSTNSQNRSTSNQSSPGSGEPDRLLQSLRDLDTANNLCADCNSAVKTEWVSINLGVILCIECSGIHRSLGTHVSKIRSLTLDTQSFTPDIVALLKLVGNRVSNSVYEATLAVENNTKPMPNASRDQRLKFITAKYVDRAYITPLAIAHPNLANADDLLVMSVKRQDISGVIHALALGCSKDASDRSRGTRAVFLALAASDPAPPSGLMGPPASPTKKPAGHERVGTGSESSGYATATSSVSSKREERVAFPIAEILVLNGAEVPSSGPSFPLGPSARIWLDLKRSRDASRAQPLDHSVSVGGTGSSYGSAFGVGGAMSEKDRAKEARLQKRVSAGGRLVGLGRSVGN